MADKDTRYVTPENIASIKVHMVESVRKMRESGDEVQAIAGNLYEAIIGPYYDVLLAEINRDQDLNLIGNAVARSLALMVANSIGLLFATEDPADGVMAAGQMVGAISHLVALTITSTPATELDVGSRQ